MRTARFALFLLLATASRLDAQSPIESLECDHASGEISLAWFNPETYDAIDVYLGGALVSSLPGDSTSHILPAPPGVASVEVCVEGVAAAISTGLVCCTVDLRPPPVTGLACAAGATAGTARDATVAIDVTWTNAGVYPTLELRVNEVLDQILAGDATAATVEADPGAVVLIDVRPVTTVPGARRFCSAAAPEIPIAPSGLHCEPNATAGTVALSWALGGAYDGIEVLADGVPRASLPGDATEVVIDALAVPSTVMLDVVAAYGSLDLASSCSVELDAAACSGPSDLFVELIGNGEVSGSFTNPGGLSSVQVLRDGAVYLDLANDATDFGDMEPPAGRVVYHVVAACPDGTVVVSGGAAALVPAPSQIGFIRSDCNDDGGPDVSDAIFEIGALFAAAGGGFAIGCEAACDSNGSGRVDIADVIYTLTYLFAQGLEPPAPFPACGTDPTGALSCDSYSSCGEATPQFDTGWTHAQTAYLAAGEQEPPPSERDAPLRIRARDFDLDPGLRSFEPRNQPGLQSLVGLVNSVHGGRVRDLLRPGSLPSGHDPLNRTVSTSLNPHSGELIVTVEPPSSTMSNRGGFCYCRATWRSQIEYNGPAGPGWVIWPLSERIDVLPDGSVRWFDSLAARVDTFDAATGTAPGRDATVSFDSVANRYVIRSGASGYNMTFHGLDDFPRPGTLIEVRDRFGNAMTCQYDASGRLTGTVDDMGRNVNWNFGADGRLSSITDFAGRVTSFGYDAAGALSTVTLPAASSATAFDDGIPSNGPTGNDFPDGATWRFASRGYPFDPDVRDRIASITAPNEVAAGGSPRMAIHYGEDPSDPLTYDRVPRVHEECGFTYEQLADFIPGDTATPVRRVTAIDSNGNNVNWEFNSRFAPVACQELAVRGVNANDPASFDWYFEQDDEDRVVAVDTPEGSRFEFDYDDASPNRGSLENLLEARWIADLDRDGDQDMIATSFTYEPIFNQRRSVTLPRGNDESYEPLVADDPARVVAVDFDLDGSLHTVAAGETTRHFRYTASATFDYQEGTSEEILDLAAAEGVDLDLDGSGPLTADGVAAALSRAADLNGDGRLDLRMGLTIDNNEPPIANLAAPDSLHRVHTMTYNDYGQMTSVADPEGNLTIFEYYPESDPDGNGISEGLVRDADPVTGGYLKSILVDAAPPVLLSNAGIERRERPAPFVEASTTYEYDAAGNVTAVTDPRGVRSERAVSAWNLVTRVTRASSAFVAGNDPPEISSLEAPGYVTDYTCDYNGRCIRVQVEDRGNTSLVGEAADPMATADSVILHDILDRVIEVQGEIAAGEVVSDRFRYDGNGNLVLHVAPEGNASTWVYDDRDFVARETRGAIALPPLARLGAGDPILIDLVGGGIPARRAFTYDGNGNIVEASDCDDSDAAIANNSSLLAADRLRLVYDGFDRNTSRVDAAGNQSVYQYDPDGNMVRCVVFGAIGGATPESDGPSPLGAPVSIDGEIVSANLVSSSPLQCTEWSYNEAGAMLRRDQVLFYGGPATERPVDILDGGGGGAGGSLTPGDDQAIPGVTGVSIVGRVSQALEYDRNLAVTRSLQDDLGESTYEYDGMDRRVIVTDADGDTGVFAFDDASNVIEVQETDVDPAGIVGDDVVLTTYEYDALCRCTRVIDNIGRTSERRYNSRDLLVAVTDAKGPPGASISRRAFTGGALTVNVTNDPGNVSRYAYDGLGRRIRRDSILTASGEGDGIHVGADADGVWGDTPAPDLAQGGGDGVARAAWLYDGNSRLAGVHDDRGNLTLYLYDNLDRCVLALEGLTVDSTPDVATLLDGRSVPAPTRATRLAPQALGVDLLQGMTDRDIIIDDARFAGLFTADAGPVAPTAVTILGFDPDDLARFVLTPNRGERHFDYDALGRPVREVWFRSGQPQINDNDGVFATRRLDPLGSSSPWLEGGTTRRLYEYDGLGRITRATDNNDPDALEDDSEITLAWDSLSRCVEESSALGGAAAGVLPYATSRAWRAENRCTALTYPDGRVIGYEYDVLDRCIEVSDSSTGSDQLAVSYFGRDRISQCIFGNGTAVSLAASGAAGTLAYDGARRPVGLRHVAADGTDLLAFEHSFDRASAITEMLRGHDPENDEECSYDSAGRLVSFDRTALGAVSPHFSSWALDAEGNWAQVDSETRGHDTRNRIAQRLAADGTLTPLVHDDNGNLNSHGTNVFTYDTGNRMIAYSSSGPDASPETHTYDALGRRVRKSTPVPGAAADVEIYLYDGSCEIEARRAAGVSQQLLRFDVLKSSPVFFGTHAHRFLWDASADLGYADRASVHFNPKEYTLDKSVAWGRGAGGGGGGGGALRSSTSRVAVALDNSVWVGSRMTPRRGTVAGTPHEVRIRLIPIDSEVGLAAGRVTNPDWADLSLASRINPDDTWELVVGNPRPASLATSPAGIDYELVWAWQDDLGRRFNWTQTEGPFYIDQDSDGDGLVTGADDSHLYCHRDVEARTCALTDATGTLVEAHFFEPSGRPITVAPGPDGVLEFGGDDEYLDNTASMHGHVYLWGGSRYDAASSLHYAPNGSFHSPELGRGLQMGACGKKGYDYWLRNRGGECAGSCRVAAGDLTGDGRPDLVAGVQDSGVGASSGRSLPRQQYFFDNSARRFLNLDGSPSQDPNSAPIGGKYWLPSNFRFEGGGSGLKEDKKADPDDHRFTEKCVHCLYKLMR